MPNATTHPSARVKGDEMIQNLEEEEEQGTGGVVNTGGRVDAAMLPIHTAAGGSGPDFKDQARTVPPPPTASASNRPTANKDLLPDFKDQARNATPPPAAQGSGNPAAAFKQGGKKEEDNSPVAPPCDQQQQQHQEPQAVLVGNGQDPSVTPFAEGIPVNGDTEALPTGGGGGGALVAAAAAGSDGVAATPQTTVLRKHIVWAVALVVLGLGTVVAVVVALTINKSSGSGGPTPPPPVPSPTLTPPVVAAPTAVPIAAPLPLGAAPVAAPTTVPTDSPSTQAPTPAPMGSPPTVAPVVAPTIVSSNPPNTEAPTAPAPMGSPPTDSVVLSETAKLTASDGAAGDEFGWSVAIAGDTIVVGATGDDADNGQDSGSVYVFTRTGTTWTQQAKLTASDGAAYDYFGWSVAIAGDTIVVGAYWDDDNGSDSGSAYVFTRTGITWNEQSKLTASDGAAYDYFGWSVAIAGDTIVVGASLDNENGIDSGSAYVFTRTGTTWTEQAKLMASDGDSFDEFGFSVAIAGDTIAVGAIFGDNDNGSNSGSASVYMRTGTTWTQQAKLSASDGAASDQFGYSVAIEGDTIVVGGNPVDIGNSGSAYIFTRTGVTWTQQFQLTVSDATLDNGFGFSVAIDVDAIVVGADNADNDNGADSGSAYVYDL